MSLYSILRFIFGFLIVVYIAVHYFQSKFLYYPNTPPNSREIFEDPSFYPMPSKELWVTTSDNILLHCVLFIKSKNSPTMIYFHGNAGNIGHRFPMIEHIFRHLDINFFLVEYRGFGKSNGTPSESGLKKDSRAALKFLSETDLLTCHQFFVFGRSLGGAIAIDLVANTEKYKENIIALIVENTFTSVPEMAKHLLPFTKYFPFLVHIKWNSEKSIQKIEAPILFLSGQKDELIPPFMMRKLYLNAKNSRNPVFFSLENGTHMTTWNEYGYDKKLKEFINSYLPKKDN
ncbi:protein abhd13 [Anaeramoeba ignava]|uniref:Protein abhd13 n=1 Tax=Anaeramoeba ignava TaxID=1746090 RepID=A0A9Q0L6D4_ANAIG|nr:protein abhd13 [Anaeramoeba ignava]